MIHTQPSPAPAAPPAAVAPALPARRRRGRPGAPAGWAVLGACALAALYARACLLHLTTGVVGGGNDGYENLWNNWWVKTALLDLHQSPFYTHYIYYPTGVSLLYHTLNPFNGLLTMPFNAILGPVAAINLLFVASLAGTCCAAWLLLRDLVGHPAAAFAGAAFFTFGNPLVLGFLGAGQAQKLAAEWLPLYFFALFRALHGRPIWAPSADTSLRYETRRPLGYAALAVLLLLITSLTDWQYLLYEVLATVLYFGFMLLTHRPWRAKGRIFAHLAGIGGLYAAIVTPTLLVPMVQEALANPWLNVGYQSASHSIDVANLLGPGPSNPGYLALALGLAGFWAARGAAREPARFWALITGLFYLLALGPYLVLGGQMTGVPLPYHLIQGLPLIDVGRDPARFSSLALLGLGVLVAFGLRALLVRLAAPGVPARLRRAAPFVSTVILGSFLVLSLGGPVLAAGNVTAPPPDWPALYEQIGQDPATYALVELPLFTEKGRQEHFYQMYQVLHHKPRLGGHWSRDHGLDNPNNFVKHSSLFHHLLLLDAPRAQLAHFYPAHDFLQRTDYATQGRAILNYYQVRYLVLYKEALDADWDTAGFAQIAAQVLGPGAQPAYEDRLLRVYRVPDGPPATNPLTLDTGDGWYDTETRADGLIYRWADSTPLDPGGPRQPSQLYTMNLTSHAQAATLHFTAFAYRQARPVVVALDDAPLTTITLPPNETLTPVSLALILPPGNHRITFSTPAAPLATGTPLDKRVLSFAVAGLTLQVK